MIASNLKENSWYVQGVCGHVSEVFKAMAKVSPDDENNLFIVLDAFGLPLYKIEDELYQHYVLTCDHRRVKPMSKEEFIYFLKHMETQGVFSSFKKEGKTYWKRLISFKDLDKEE